MNIRVSSIVMIAINMVLLMALVAATTFSLLRSSALLSVEHDIISYDISPTEFKHSDGGTYTINLTTTVKREVPPDCRLIVERVVRDEDTDAVVYTTMGPGSAARSGTSTIRTKLAIPHLDVGCYNIVTRATNDCGLRTLMRTSPARRFCVVP